MTDLKKWYIQSMVTSKKKYYKTLSRLISNMPKDNQVYKIVYTYNPDMYYYAKNGHKIN